MRTLYIDCFSGASGDMLLGALVDLGVDVGDLERELATLGLGDVHLRASRVTRCALSAAKVDVVVGGFVEGLHGAVHPYSTDPSPGDRAPHGH